MKNIDVINAFVSGATKGKTTNLRIEGDKLINYNTVLAERDGDRYIVNVTKYSQSTTVIQNKLCVAIPERYVNKFLANVPMNASSLVSLV